MPRVIRKVWLPVLLIILAARTSIAAPEVSFRQAAEIAENAKADRAGGDAVFVQSLALERGSLFGGKTVWIAKWSAALPANDPGNSEVGIEIAMDGSVKRIVKAPASARGAKR